MRPSSQRWTVARLGCAQTLAWASTYYLPAMLAVPMARDLGVATSMVFAAFSLALIVSALLGPLAGRAIDRHGGRPVTLHRGVNDAELHRGPAQLRVAQHILLRVAVLTGHESDAPG
mgnify:CR=1 FL=1